MKDPTFALNNMDQQRGTAHRGRKEQRGIQSGGWSL
jgi:hypothetical protein